MVASPVAASEFQFDDSLGVVLPGGTSGVTERVVVGDVDGDGRPDIVAAVAGSPLPHPGYDGRIGIWLQRSNGSFRFPVYYDCLCKPSQVKLI